MVSHWCIGGAGHGGIKIVIVSLEESSHHVSSQVPRNARSYERRARETRRLAELVTSREGYRVGYGEDQCYGCDISFKRQPWSNGDKGPKERRC